MKKEMKWNEPSGDYKIKSGGIYDSTLGEDGEPIIYLMLKIGI